MNKPTTTIAAAGGICPPHLLSEVPCTCGEPVRVYTAKWEKSGRPPVLCIDCQDFADGRDDDELAWEVTP